VGAWARLADRFDAAFDAVLRWDDRTLHAVSRSAALRRYARVFATASFLGDGYLWGGLGLGLILFGRTADRLNVLIGLGISIVNVAVCRFVKILFGRRRPENGSGGGRLRTIDTYAFPSGHATTSFGLAWLVAWTYPHPVAIAGVYLVAATISFSRIYVREHYPSDVLFGAVLGTVTSAALFPFFRWLFL